MRHEGLLSCGSQSCPGCPSCLIFFDSARNGFLTANLQNNPETHPHAGRFSHFLIRTAMSEWCAGITSRYRHSLGQHSHLSLFTTLQTAISVAPLQRCSSAPALSTGALSPLNLSLYIYRYIDIDLNLLFGTTEMTTRNCNGATLQRTLYWNR